MKYKIEIIIFTIILLASSLLWHSIYAQEVTPIARLAQDYILRLNNELREKKDIIPSIKQDAVIVNPDAVLRDAVEESIDTISNTVDEIKKEKQNTISKIKDSIKKDIDNSILEIIKKVDKPALELQKVIDEERNLLFEKISDGIDSIKNSEDESLQEKISKLKLDIDDSIKIIEQNLQGESEVHINFEKSKIETEQIISNFEKFIEEKQNIIDSRQGFYVFVDSDSDGISDYAENYIYNTDPYKNRTKGDGKTDGEKIRDGIDPNSDEEKNINYQDPREDKESFVSSSYKLDKVEFIKEDKKLIFEGTALPNSYITLFIYSKSIITNVKTDEDGFWNYTLEKDLENGEHQIYIATVDNYGKIVVRSNPILFTKSSDAATIGIEGTQLNSHNSPNFIKDNFILITLAILIAIVIFGMMFIGNHKNISSAISELKNQVNSK